MIEKLDVLPLQVHIETQVAEVTLTGDLSYGVSWFFERAVTDNGLPDAVGIVGQSNGKRNFKMVRGGFESALNRPDIARAVIYDGETGHGDGL